MSRRGRGRIPETSDESIFQRLALARTFYARRRHRGRARQKLPPNSPAALI